MNFLSFSYFFRNHILHTKSNTIFKVTFYVITKKYQLKNLNYHYILIIVQVEELEGLAFCSPNSKSVDKLLGLPRLDYCWW